VALLFYVISSAEIDKGFHFKPNENENAQLMRAHLYRASA